MIIDLKDPRVNKAIELVQDKHNVPFGREFERIFEEQYHCKIVPEPGDWSCTRGSLYISEDKYANWFVLQFGHGGK